MTLNKISFTDTLNFYIAADSGKVIHSSDGGINWIVLNTGLTNNIVDVAFLNASTGFAIAVEYGLNNPNYFGSKILKTTDGGVHWDSTYRVDSAIFYSKIKFSDALNGMIAGDLRGIIRTTNGGVTWTQDHIDTSFFSEYPMKNFVNRRPDFAIACGGINDIRGVIWITTNNGLNWVADGVTPEPLYGIHFFDDNHIICVGGDFEFGASMASTTNGGVTWEYIMLEQFGIANGLAFRTPSEGWMALSIGEKFLYTQDGGSRWFSLKTPNQERLNDVVFSNRRIGIAVGEKGAIMKFNTVYAGVSNNGTNLPDGIDLKQNYPNPFNPETIISFSLQRPEFVSLKIFDMLGKEVKTLFEKRISQGEHKIRFDASELPAGVYYYTLKTDNNFTETKKMVLVK